MFRVTTVTRVFFVCYIKDFAKYQLSEIYMHFCMNHPSVEPQCFLNRSRIYTATAITSFKSQKQEDKYESTGTLSQRFCTK